MMDFDRSRIPVLVNGEPFTSVKRAWTDLKINAKRSARRKVRRQLRAGRPRVSFTDDDNKVFDFEKRP
jgi:hypothetical protein